MPTMTTFVRITAVCLMCWMPVQATADNAPSDAKWYGALRTSLGKDTIDGVSQTGIGNGMLIGGEIDGSLEDDEVDDYTAGFGIALGRRIGYWNIDAEFIYRYRTDWDTVATTPSIQAITNVFANVETNTLMLNIARRGSISAYWSWEVGAGIGIVDKEIEAEYIERATATTAEVKFKDDSSDTDFIYAVFAGVTRDLGGPWTFNSRLRYIDLGELEEGPFPNRPATVKADHYAIELQFSLERNF